VPTDNLAAKMVGTALTRLSPSYAFGEDKEDGNSLEFAAPTWSQRTRSMIRKVDPRFSDKIMLK
jgi:hypothetical protein